MERTRDDHMRWCKQRAYQEFNFYKASDPASARRNAMASMLSDLGKHPETAKMLETAAMLMVTVTDETSLRKFIDGFAE